MFDAGLIKSKLEDVQGALELILRRFSEINSEETFADTYEGRKVLDAVSMQIIGVGENLKAIDKIAGTGYLDRYPTLDSRLYSEQF